MVFISEIQVKLMIIFEMLLFYMNIIKIQVLKEIYLFMYLVKLMNHKVFKTKSLKKLGINSEMKLKWFLKIQILL